jgi:multidrug efflux pump subunit AcrB
MLPHDNKNELQVVIDMPEGTTLERTAAAARELAAVLRELPEVTDVETYVGTSAPFNFNGLVRHYYLRSGPLVADLQVNLLPKHARERASHPFAKSVRPLLAPVAARWNANVKVSEVPPGPPVLSTLVAEIYGPTLGQRLALAREVRAIFESTPGVVDVDDSLAAGRGGCGSSPIARRRASGIAARRWSTPSPDPATAASSPRSTSPPRASQCR